MQNINHPTTTQNQDFEGSALKHPEAHQRTEIEKHIFPFTESGDAEMHGNTELVTEHTETFKPEQKDQHATAIFGELIHTYTRQQAIDDGVLVDVSAIAKEARFCIPVAMTRTTWADCVEWTEGDNKRQTYQDESGRLWDVIWMASRAARRGGREIRFQLYRVPRGGRGVKPRLTTLKMICGPGDEGEPVITIMLPNED